MALRPWSFGADPEVWEAEVAQGLDGLLAGCGKPAAVPALSGRGRSPGAPPGAGSPGGPRARPPSGAAARTGRAGGPRRDAAAGAGDALPRRPLRPCRGSAHSRPGLRSQGPLPFASAGLADLALPPEGWRAEALGARLQGARTAGAGFGEAMRQRAAKCAVRAIETWGVACRSAPRGKAPGRAGRREEAAASTAGESTAPRETS